jgi:hypothetical protein
VLERNIMNVLLYDSKAWTTDIFVDLGHVLFVTAEVRNAVDELDKFNFLEGPFHIFLIDGGFFAHFFQSEWVINVLSNEVDDTLGPP